jgi:hypothetical protein
MSLLNILNAIPAAASRFGGSVIQQAPKAAARVPQAARSVGFDPLNQVPAFFSRFGGSVIQSPSVRNVQSLRGIVPAAGAGMAGFSGAALDPLLRGSQYVQQQLQGFGALPRPGQAISKPKPTEGYSSYGTYTVGGVEYDINSGRPTYMPPGSVYPSSSVAPFVPAKQTSSPAAERAYQSEKAAVAQQVAQDPALSQYDRDRAAAVASGDQAKMDAVRDQGMALWAKANPTLAAKVRPGQSGYDAIQGALAGQAAAQGLGYQLPQQIIFTPPPGVNAPQGLPSVQSITPTETYGAQGIDVDPEMRKKFQALLNQAKS